MARLLLPTLYDSGIYSSILHGAVSKKVLSFLFLLLKVCQYLSVKNISSSSSTTTASAAKMKKLCEVSKIVSENGSKIDLEN